MTNERDAENRLVAFSLRLSGNAHSLYTPTCAQRAVSKRWQYYIWLVVIARLLLPFAPEINVVRTLFQEIDRGIAQTVFFTPPVQQGSTSAPKVDLPPSDSATGETDIPQSGQRKPTGPADNPAQNIPLVMEQNLWLGWLVVALILFIRKITIYQSFVKYILAGCV